MKCSAFFFAWERGVLNLVPLERRGTCTAVYTAVPIRYSRTFDTYGHAVHAVSTAVRTLIRSTLRRAPRGGPVASGSGRSLLEDKIHRVDPKFAS
jgi:hypothetical protein